MTLPIHRITETRMAGRTKSLYYQELLLHPHKFRQLSVEKKTPSRWPAFIYFSRLLRLLHQMLITLFSQACLLHPFFSQALFTG